jgi:hypothetical protein
MSLEQKTIESPAGETDLRNIVRQAIEEFVRAEHRQAEPAYKVELHEERKRRESLEARVNQLVEENKRARAAADEADRHAQIRTELQRAGISKIDLAFKAIRDDIVRATDGHLQAKGHDNKSLQEYVSTFVQENPDFFRRALQAEAERRIPQSRTRSPTRRVSLSKAFVPA